MSRTTLRNHAILRKCSAVSWRGSWRWRIPAQRTVAGEWGTSSKVSFVKMLQNSCARAPLPDSTSLCVLGNVAQVLKLALYNSWPLYSPLSPLPSLKSKGLLHSSLQRVALRSIIPCPQRPPVCALHSNCMEGVCAQSHLSCGVLVGAVGAWAVEGALGARHGEGIQNL